MKLQETRVSTSERCGNKTVTTTEIYKQDKKISIIPVIVFSIFCIVLLVVFGLRCL